MNLENMIMLDQEERILFIGERVFSFLNSKKSYPLGSAAGKLEVGDLLLYFAKQRKDSVDEIEQIKEKCPFKKIVSEEEGMLMVCCLERRELLPLVKSIPRDLPKQAVLLDTMYESNEIVVEQKDRYPQGQSERAERELSTGGNGEHVYHRERGQNPRVWIFRSARESWPSRNSFRTKISRVAQRRRGAGTEG